VFTSPHIKAFRVSKSSQAAIRSGSEGRFDLAHVRCLNLHFALKGRPAAALDAALVT
jgi:hypothetical protein